MIFRVFSVFLFSFLFSVQTASAQQQQVVWVQIEAQPSLVGAQASLRSYASRLPDVNGFALGGGWYGIALGPTTPEAADQVLRVYRNERSIPADSFIAYSTSFRQQFWPVGANVLSLDVEDSPVAAQVPVQDATEAAEVAVSPVPEPEPADETLAEARRGERALDRNNLRQALMLMEAAASDTAQPLGPRLRKIVWNVVKMPTMMALMAGLVVSVLPLSIPAPVFRFTDMLAASAGAVSLIVIGGSLAGLPLRGNKSLALQTTLGKLVLHPMIVALVAGVFVLTGLLDISPQIRAALILSAAMPIFATYTIFAQARGHEGAASLASLAATVLAFFTLNGLLWLLT